MNNMFDDDQVYPIIDEYNPILTEADEVIPELNTNPVFEDEPSFQEPLLSISDNKFEQHTTRSDESYTYDFSDDSRNIKFANFASEAYLAPNDRQMNLLGYPYNKGLSDKNLSTCIDKQDKKIVISLRGTVPTNFRDLVSNVGIVSTDKAFNTTRLSAHKKMINEVLQKYPGYKLVLGGHSLGWYLAEQLASDFPSSQIIVFNPGTSLS